MSLVPTIICIDNQVPLGSNETVLVNSRFDKWLWEKDVMKVSHYLSENGFFTSDEYRKNCDNKGQTHSFQELVPSIRMREQNVQSKL